MSELDLTSPVPLIHVSGGPEERGISYGKQAGDRIAIALDIYREAFGRVGINWAQAMKIAGRFLPAVEKFDADMLAEIKGIAKGSNQPVEAIIAINARTEIIFWRDNELDEKSETDMQEECTSALALPSATANGHVIHGQNWDWNPKCAACAVVLRIENDNGPDILTFVEAGQLARHGMNGSGLALTVNGLQCDKDCGNIGTPNPLIRRRMLLSNSFAGGLDAVLNGDISFSHSLTLSHPAGVGSILEATPGETFWLQPENGLLVHANHFKCPVARSKILDIGLRRCPESLYRDQRVLDHMMANHGKITIDTFKEAFTDTFGTPDAVLRTPKARPGGNLSGTVASIIMDTMDRKMWVAPSPYLQVNYTEYSLDY
ncbi:C45 family autoproteolytic acyltransferase/hydolase [Kordiimonas pumila]|uniref:C45 family autoproteolytic acyltransferase/hydrolase n=1 Tax=Kordiimonas pumila TaxID=2161677 RepID=A0ABV7D8H3_9PROT|nr:C45 family peptidase [Kordiimonas pumila]